jgi:PLP dependent protein
MSSIQKNISLIKNELPAHVTLVVISKTHPQEVIMEAYNTGHRIFGENKVQELVSKFEQLPKDIQWHMVGHLQSNKVKYIAHFVSLIHSIDSYKLLKEVNKQARKNDRIIDCLLQVHIAEEDTKFGLSKQELTDLLKSDELSLLENIRIIGLMGMATFTNNREQVKREFSGLARIFNQVKDEFFNSKPYFSVLSMGMSGDYDIAVSQGSTMVRIGSSIFGERFYDIK